MIPEEIRRFAEAPGAWGEIPAESGLTRILTDRYCLLLGGVPTFTSVSRLRLHPAEIAEVLAEVRELVAEHGHRDAIWWVGPSSTPDDLAERLQANGLVPDERPNSEPHDGLPVGTGRALFAADCPAVLMLGGGVVPDARGRGVYRALVRARWDDAVAAGTPALVTHAGSMSRPILERLGFQGVAEQEILLDPGPLPTPAA